MVTSDSMVVASARFTELLVMLVEVFRVRLVAWPVRDEHLLFVTDLQLVSQHRSVNLLEPVEAHQAQRMAWWPLSAVGSVPHPQDRYSRTFHAPITG